MWWYPYRTMLSIDIQNIYLSFLLIRMAFQNRTGTSPISQLSVDLFGSWERPSPLYCHSLLVRLPFNQKEMAASSLKLGGKGKFWDISLALQKFYAKHFLQLVSQSTKTSTILLLHHLLWLFKIVLLVKFDLFIKKRSWQSLVFCFKNINSCAFVVDTWREKKLKSKYFLILVLSQSKPKLKNV